MKKKFLSVLVVLGFMMTVRPALALADDAEALYKSKCQPCHGADGKGSPAGQKIGVKDFHSPEVAKQTDEELFTTTKQGKGKMPAYDKKLTDDQIKQLVKYIRSLK
jgi:mono/diheme cytochrome c family protein